VQAQKKVDLSATIAGQVTHLAVKEGDRVRKGQFCSRSTTTNPRRRRAAASLDAGPAAGGGSARARLDQARPRLTAGGGEPRGPIISNADLDQARTALPPPRPPLRAAERRVEQAQARSMGARDTLARRRSCPIDGIVTAKRSRKARWPWWGVLTSGDGAAHDLRLSVVEAEMDVDETSIPSVKVGHEARFAWTPTPTALRRCRTEVGSSPIDRTAAQQQSEAIKFKVKIQIRNPPDTSARPSVQAES